MLRHKLLVLIMPCNTALLDHVLADGHLHVTNVVAVEGTACRAYF